MRHFRVCWVLWTIACASAFGHAPPIYIPAPPLQVREATIVDRTGAKVLLRGVAFDALEIEAPNPITYRLIRQRWNLNSVRITLRVARWLEQGDAYLDRAASAVQAARSEGLIVILALKGGGSLPGDDEVAFWKTVAARFRDDSGIVFSLFDEPSAAAVPDASQGVRWAFWRNGGTLANGTTAAGMQALVDTIRNAGATSQIISAPAFHDALGFQGFSPEHYLNGPNIIYEVHPSFVYEATDAQRQSNFGFLTRRFPVYAGSWGMPFGRDSAECRALPTDAAEVTLLLLQTLVWFDTADISWTVADFAPGSLLRDFDEFTPTDMPVQPSACDSVINANGPGIGSTLLLWVTGDALGFGSILAELTASLAGGPPGDFAPGQLVAFYGQGMGPEAGATGQLDASGKMPDELGGVRVYFNSIPAPIVSADAFQISAQVPYEVASAPSVEVQMYFRDVPSNRIRFGVAPAVPEPFTQRGNISDALARNEDGQLNSLSNPAARGSVVVLSVTGSGQTNPPGVTGVPDTATPLLATSVTVGQRPAEVLSWRGSATEPGRQEVTVRIPPDLTMTGAAAQRFALVLRAGTYASRAGVVLWVR